jgi:hypothetical protein
MNIAIRDMILSAFNVGDSPRELFRYSTLDYEEEEIISNIFQGKRWNDLELEHLHEWETEHVCSYLAPEALQYYLPGLLLSFLEEGTRINNGLLFDILCQCVLTIQLPISPDDRHHETKTYLMSLNILQKHVIALWVKEMEVVANFFFPKNRLEELKIYWDKYFTLP